MDSSAIPSNSILMSSYNTASLAAIASKLLLDKSPKICLGSRTLDSENVRSSLARRLGLKVGVLKAHKDRYVDGVVEMMLDATQKFKERLTKERLFDWHADLFPGVCTTSDKFRVGRLAG